MYEIRRGASLRNQGGKYQAGVGWRERMKEYEGGRSECYHDGVCVCVEIFKGIEDRRTPLRPSWSQKYIKLSKLCTKIGL